MKLNKKLIKKLCLYIIILLLLLEIIKIRPKNEIYTNIVENYKTYEKKNDKKLNKQIGNILKQQKK